MDSSTLIHFLPTLFSQLLRLVARTSNQDVAENSIKVMIHVVTAVTEANRTQLLHTYVKVREWKKETQDTKGLI